MKTLKTLSLILFVLTLAIAAQAQLIISTNLPATNAVSLLTTNRASVYAIEISSDKAGVVDLYDSDTLADPYFGTNYVNASYVSRLTYATNIVSSYVGTTGVTNFYTNTGVFTASVTNAASTNALPKLVSLAFGANVAQTYNIDALFVRGITARHSTNLNIILYYRRAQ